VGNRANLEILRNDLILRYGGWTDAKGQLNFNAAEALGPIVSVDTSDQIFHAFQMLINERTNWNNAEEMFRPSYYRSWLIKRISQWDLLKNTYIAMKLDVNMNYAAGKEQVIRLVDQERTDLALARATVKGVSRSEVQPVVQHDFSLSSNHVTITMEMYEAMVAAAAAGIPYNAAKPQILASNVRTGVCFASAAVRTATGTVELQEARS